MRRALEAPTARPGGRARAPYEETMVDSHQPTTLDYQATGGSVRWGFRWWVCALLFFATTINYIDRQIIGVLKPELSRDFGWNEIDYSNIVFWFQVAYAIGYAGGGWFMDRVGVRRGYALAVTLWSIAA